MPCLRACTKGQVGQVEAKDLFVHIPRVSRRQVWLPDMELSHEEVHPMSGQSLHGGEDDYQLGEGEVGIILRVHRKDTPRRRKNPVDQKRDASQRTK